MNVLEQLVDFLAYQQEEGVETLAVSRQTLAALTRVSASPRAPARPARRPESTGTRPEAGAETARPPGIRVPGDSLDAIAEQIAACTACPLCKTRNNTVPGEGNGDAPDVMFIGEGPGADEDEQGRPFVGKAGQLLDKMIAAMGYRRDEVFIGNIVKCRPPDNRVPSPEEMNACLPYLRAQIGLIRPKLIVALGKTAVQGLLNEKVAITRQRGVWRTWQGIDLMPTYHPAYLLRSPNRKGEAWADLKAVLARLGKEPPAPKTNKART